MSDSGIEKRRVTVVGDGQMGLVMADAINAGGHEVRVWGPFEDHVLDLKASRTSDRLPGFELPETVAVVPDAHHALAGADIVVCAIPCQFIRPVFKDLVASFETKPTVVSVAKGIENETLQRPTEIIQDVLGDRCGSTVCFSGPTIATELADHMIATMVAASSDPAASLLTQQVMSTRWLRVYTNEDLIGVEIAGAVKNVVAIAAGVLDGLGHGTNAKSALLARGLAEIVRFGVAMGAEPETFFGIAGVGDLATTCFSRDGRNRSCGEAIGKGMPLEDYLRESNCVVEGVATTKSIMQLVERLEVDVPIMMAVNSVLFEGVPPREAIQGLLAREAGREIVG